MIGSVSRRYAKAIFGLARDQRALEATAAELRSLAAIVEHPAVRTTLSNPMLAPSKRRRFADAILDQLKPSEITVRFTQLLAERHRLGEMPGIARQYDLLLDQYLRRAQLAVRSSQALSEAQQQNIIAAFGRVTGKTVMPSFEIDPDLLGGVVVEAEGKVYDGSIKTQLERLAKELSGAA